MIARSKKRNYEALTALEKKSSEMFDKEEINYELFRLAVNTSWEGFENISKSVSASTDEDVWITVMSYKDKKHRDELCAKMSNVLFCNGVPLRHNLFLAFSNEAAFVTLLWGFLMACDSSSIT